jgi:chromosomal replication initiation ATPase DnaA
MTQLILDLGHRQALGEADFLVAPCNQAAIRWLDRWPDWPSPALMLQGPPGCGKTHLARVFAARSHAPIIEAASLATEAVPRLLGASEACVVDDADRAAAEPLLHLYNLVAERRGTMLLTAAEPPARWPGLLPDLRSRLAAAPLVSVQATDDALLAALLVKQFADRQIAVSEELVLFLLRHMERSFEAARRLVTDLDAAALRDRRAVTIPLARTVLGLRA